MLSLCIHVPSYSSCFTSVYKSTLVYCRYLVQILTKLLLILHSNFRLVQLQLHIRLVLSTSTSETSARNNKTHCRERHNPLRLKPQRSLLFYSPFPSPNSLTPYSDLVGVQTPNPVVRRLTVRGIYQFSIPAHFVATDPIRQNKRSRKRTAQPGHQGQAHRSESQI